MNAQASEALADPALGNDVVKARALLCDGADVAYDFNAAVQNAAKGGHLGVLKLAIVADEIVLGARDDAYRCAIRANRDDVVELLGEMNVSAEAAQRQLRSSFVDAVNGARKEEASALLDQMVALVFPRSPKVE
jgi:hypothetical protein